MKERINDSQAQLQTLKNEVKDVVGSLEQAIHRRDSILIEIQDAEETLATLKELSRGRNELIAAIEILRNKKSLIDSQVVDLATQRSAAHSALNDLEDQILRLQKETKTALSESVKSKKELSKLIQEIKDANSVLKSVQAQSRSLKNEIDRTRKAHESEKKKIMAELSSQKSVTLEHSEALLVRERNIELGEQKLRRDMSDFSGIQERWMRDFGVLVGRLKKAWATATDKPFPLESWQKQLRM